MKQLLRPVALLTLAGCLSWAAQDDASPAPRTRSVRELVKDGSPSIPVFRADLSSPDRATRLQAVRAIVEIGTQHSLEPLIQATRDNDAEIQVLAANGLVNFYLPGYVQGGMSGSLRRIGTSFKGRFTDVNDQVIDPTIEVRPGVIQALGRLASGGISMISRANAARAVGILRGRAAVPDLIDALRSKDSDVLYEVLVALQKIRDPQTGPQIAFLLRDLDERVQVTALETTGLLRNQEASPQVRDALQRARSDKVRRAALTALAMMPDEANRTQFTRHFTDKNPDLRAASAEGFARLRHQPDLPSLEAAFNAERKPAPRLALAFALVMLGRQGTDAAAPLSYLMDTLNSRSYRGVAQGYLVELGQQPDVRRALITRVPGATKEEKLMLAQILSEAGQADVMATLEALSRDQDADVAQEGLRGLRLVRTKQ